jgi:2-oxoisovalerate dehydrogenase E1 component
MPPLTERAPSRELGGLSRSELLAAWRTMLLSRYTDDREENLKRQNKVFFQISAAGHEAIQVAMARHLRVGSDWFYLYYRDRALATALGMTPLDHLLQSVAAEADRSSRGRQMPTHFSDPEKRIVSVSSPTGTQYLQAVGTAEGAMRARLDPAIAAGLERIDEGEVVLVCSGEGTTSEGEFWEALNTASNLRLPVIFLIEDNQFAISVPVEVQTTGGDISRLVQGFPNLLVLR